MLQVLDIPDQGPEWISLKAVTRIPEDISIFSPVCPSSLVLIHISLVGLVLIHISPVGEKYLL